MLSFTNVTLRRGPRVLLSDFSATIHPGQRVGVVGRNGTGKSSLFAMILGELAADAGDVALPRDLTIATVRQETPALATTALDYVLDGDDQWRQVHGELQRAEQRGDAEPIARLHERLHAIDGYTTPARAGRLLAGLGFSSAQQAQPVGEFSGGWRMRLNLAQALMCRSDLLLLDEPTNHLDLDAVLWLQRWLAAYAGTLLVISHDRDFLDQATTHTLHVEGQAATLYSGNYSSCERQRAERMAQQQAKYQAQARQARHLQQFVDRFRAKATKARQAQSRIKQLEKMQLTEPAHWDAPFTFELAPPARLPAPLIRWDEVSVGYGDTAVVAGIRFSLQPGDRIGVLGRNGAGKSTLMKALASGATVVGGDELRDPYLRVGYFAQHQLEQLDGQASPITQLQRLDENAREQELRDFLGGFDFVGDRVFEPVAPFSGGEKARLVLALLVYQKPNLLLLDEPTNHLDLEMRHALERALQEFAGAMVLVAHDRHLLDSTCDSLWLVDGGRCADFDGDLDDYARWVRQRQEPADTDDAVDADDAAGDTPGGRVSARDQRREAAERRARQKPLRDRLRKLENRVERLSAQLQQIENELADPQLYAQDGGRVAELTRTQGQLRVQLDEAEAEWMEAAEALEATD